MTRIRRHPILVGVALVLLIVLTVLGASAMTVWRAAHDDEASRVERADVIIVLGAAQYGGTPSPVFQGRLDHAVLLFRQGRAASVMVVGGRAPGDSTSEAQAGRDYLVSQGIPAGSALASRIDGQRFGVLRMVAIRSGLRPIAVGGTRAAAKPGPALAGPTAERRVQAREIRALRRSPVGDLRGPTTGRASWTAKSCSR